MADIEVTSTSTAGYATRSEIGEWEMTIDSTDQEGPNPNAVLVANYASCFIPALRVAASEAGVEDLGTIDIEVSADLDEDDDLESIAFDLSAEGSLDAGTDLIARAEEICHVHAALREELQAEVTLK